MDTQHLDNFLTGLKSYLSLARLTLVLIAHY